ncbi:MAG: bifunctional diaminohydroxyphosphoribosylaminopyrimidine deaminase/5-amino-6-(5-phosphoribosylamino)uracil reductase RibD [bacterium]
MVEKKLVSDIDFMSEALGLAKKGLGRTSPNPSVGAVVVKDGEIIGSGFHKTAGQPHAEISSLEEARENAKGATLYTNIEPCCHHGRTPPCVEAIIKSGIKRVVIAMQDPNPKVNGKGIEILQRHKIEVITGILEQKARKLNEIFIKYITTNTPFVILKLALTMDGKIATKTGDSRWISGEKGRLYVHKMRNVVDAIMIGIGTVIRDNPRLTTRLPARYQPRDAKRVIIDSLLKVPTKAEIFSQSSSDEIIIITTFNAPQERVKNLEKVGAKILFVPSTGNNKVSLKHAIIELSKLEITSVMIEGGSEISASSLQEGIVDKVIFFIAPKIIGGNSAPCAVGGEGVATLEEAIKLENIKMCRLGDDLMLEGYVKK